MQKHKLSLFEKLSFGLAGMGQNIVYNLVITLVMFYYTDVALIKPEVVASIMFFTRLWDAINDPLMGMIVDKTKTRFGKLRPYLMAVPIPLAIFTILTFAVPNMSESIRVLYAIISYNLWSMTYTVSDIPYWGMSVAITDNPKERLHLVTMVRIFCNVGMAIGILVPPILINSLGGSTVENVAGNSQAYLYTAMIIGIIGSALFALAGFFTKERVHQVSTETPKFRILAKNKPLLVLQTSRILGSFRMVIATAGLYFANKNLADPTQYTILGGILIAAMIFSMFFAPLCVRLWGKKLSYNYSLILGFVAHAVLFIVGYENLIFVFGLLFISGISLGINDVVVYSIVGDTVDYLEHKTGQRAEGMVFSLNTFTTILQSALGLAFIGIVLSLVGYQGDVLEQTPLAYQGIFSLLSLFPAIACLLSLIPMYFYKFTTQEHEQILAELHP
ncbi:MAG: glycoside/pentoside/hexuronide transporter [Erysipelotrichaceae bacterium]|nr:MAG: glycoside/pentoside/hexuronide [Erysipelotrichaceae bacterium]TXT18284.1 MAG: glycoside/pentoside/hexuronide transporter [Erysipelotrichaceae bacterium]